MYKRQVFNPQPLTDVLRNYTRKQALAIKDYDHAAMEICAQILDIDVTPVSYTHLDVYKRQT